MVAKKVSISLSAGVLGVFLLVYAYNAQVNLSLVGRSVFGEKETVKDMVPCPINASVGSQTLRMEFYIPAEGRRQQNEIRRIIPIVQNEFLLYADDEHMKKDIRERNFDAIKVWLVNVINRNSSIPINSVYFNSFNFMRSYS